MNTTPQPANKWIGLVAWVLFSLAASLSGLLGMPGDWYDQLEKPAWTPPGWLFGPAWTLLYIVIGVAAWVVWLRGGFAARRTELGAFGLQWLLNAMWTPLFFAFQRPGLALVEIVLLWLAALVTTVLFFRVRPLAGWLLVPYMGWLSFATALNAAIWWLNR